MRRTLQVLDQSYALKRPFTISRGTKTHARVITVHIHDGSVTGHGEGVPYPRYGETVEASIKDIETVRPMIENGAGREDLLRLMPAGAARAALDAALIDLEAKQSGRTVADLFDLPAARATITAATISLGTPAAMAEEALGYGSHPLLKIKLGDGLADIERVKAVRAVAPAATLIVDANEGWQVDDLPGLFLELRALGVALIEQPLPASDDAALANIARPVPVYADESFHGEIDWAALKACYDGVNIKLDKTGGLTAAVSLARQAKAHDMKIMVGCMVGTSLAMAPALALAAIADYADLDGSILLAEDRPHALQYVNGALLPPTPALWG